MSSIVDNKEYFNDDECHNCEHGVCKPIAWDLRHFFDKNGFEGGNNHRHYYNIIVAEFIRKRGIQVELEFNGTCYDEILGNNDDNRVVIQFESKNGWYCHPKNDGWFDDENKKNLIDDNIPLDIRKALWDFQNRCSIEGFKKLPQEWFFLDSERKAE